MARWKPTASASAATGSHRRCDFAAVIASAAKQSRSRNGSWIASSAIAPRNDERAVGLNRQHVVVDLGDGVDAAQSHGRAEFIGDEIDRLGDAGTAEGTETVNIGPPDHA